MVEPISAPLKAPRAVPVPSFGPPVKRSLLEQPDLLPSARVLAVMDAEHASSHIAFTRAQSQQTKAKLLALPFPAALQAKFDQLSAESVREQKAIEAADTLPFEAWRQQYVSAERLGTSRAAIAPALASV